MKVVCPVPGLSFQPHLLHHFVEFSSHYFLAFYIKLSAAALSVFTSYVLHTPIHQCMYFCQEIVLSIAAEHFPTHMKTLQKNHKK